MKKVILSLIAIAGLGLVASKTNAQTSPLKIGYFDLDQMVRMMPDFKTIIQPKLEAYQKDSLGPQKDNLDLQLSRADSSYKADSLSKKSPSTLKFDRDQVQNLYSNYINWNQIVQNATQQKYGEVAKPTYDKVAAAYKKVLAANKITIVLNPNALEGGTDPKAVTNLFELVAKELGVKLDNGGEQGSGAGAGGN